MQLAVPAHVALSCGRIHQIELSPNGAVPGDDVEGLPPIRVQQRISIPVSTHPEHNRDRAQEQRQAAEDSHRPAEHGGIVSEPGLHRGGAEVAEEGDAGLSPRPLRLGGASSFLLMRRRPRDTGVSPVRGAFEDLRAHESGSTDNPHRAPGRDGRVTPETCLAWLEPACRIPGSGRV
jgi:hypothetical protein